MSGRYTPTPGENTHFLIGLCSGVLVSAAALLIAAWFLS
jgi:hypothetical protein